MYYDWRVNMELNLKGKVVVITGGAAGIGRATSIEFLKEGAIVAVCGRRNEKIEKFYTEMSNLGYQVYGEALNIRDCKAVQRFAENIIHKFGKIDIWVNNAGVALDKPFWEFTKEEWDNIVETNLEAVWNCTRICARYMMEKESGVIINISSYASKIPIAGGPIYAATKAGVSSLTKSFASELAPYNIRVIGIVPGMINTEISKKNIAENKDKLISNISMKRLGEAEDLAKPIVFLSSDAAGYMSGFDVEITGGKYATQNTDWPWRIKNERGKEKNISNGNQL